MSRAELTVPVDVNAPAEAVWHTVTDWPGQGEWMLGTRVEVDGPGDGRHLGARLRAFTGVGPLGFTDTMEIVAWEPPRRLVYVWHLRFDRADATEVEITFAANAEPAGGTAVRIVHRGWERLGAVADERRERNRRGWGGLVPHYVAACAAAAPGHG